MDPKKAINIFKKSLIFIPVHDDQHWSLLIVNNPGQIAHNHCLDWPGFVPDLAVKSW